MNKDSFHPEVFVAEGAVITGDVAVGKDSSVWFHATLRGDREAVWIGEGTNIQDQAVVHEDPGFPVTIGDYVSIGHGALIHGCSIGDNTLVGMGAIVLNGAKIGANCILGAGTLVTQNMIVPEESLVIGCPGKVVRKLTAEEIRANRHNAEEYIKESRQYQNTVDKENTRG